MHPQSPLWTWMGLANLVIATSFMNIGMAFAAPDDADYFYLSSPPVREYIPESATEGVNPNLFMKEKGPKVVEFYSPLCPACNEFKAHYIRLAQETAKMYPSIAFYGVSCDKYQSVCDEYDVEDFPTLRLFNNNDSNDSDNPDTMNEEGRNLDYSDENISPTFIAQLLGVDNTGVDRNMMVAVPISKEVAVDMSKVESDTVATTTETEDDEDAENKDDNSDEEGDPKDSEEDLSQEASEQDEEDDEGDGDSGAEDEDNEGDVNEDADSEEYLSQQGKDRDESDDGDSGAEDEGDEGNVVYEAEDMRGQSDVDRTFVPDFSRSQTSVIESRIGNPPAGHILANRGNKQMNRYSSTIMGEKQNILKKQPSLRYVPSRGVNPPSSHGGAMEETTKAMRQNTLGTIEFQDRQKAYRDRVKAKMFNRGTVHAGSVQFRKETLPFHKNVRKSNLVKKTAEHIPLINQIVKMSAEEELILDTSLSLTVALENGVSMGIEELKEKAHMKRWLDLLSVSLPPEWAIHKLIDDLRINFVHATKSKDNFRGIIKRHALPRKGWSRSCKTRKSPNGFSCGMWKLLHVVTVGIAEQRGGKNLIDSGMVAATTKTFTPIEAADTIRNFIDNFFQCKPCRENFVENYDDCKKNRRCDRLASYANLADLSVADWKELPLWLWEVHNEVSVRLVREIAQKLARLKGIPQQPTPREELKAVWPNLGTCILCFNDDGTWNEGQVFLQLERTYWPGSEVDPLHDKLLTFEDDSSRGFGLLWILALLIIYWVYAMTRKQSRSIQASLLVARHVVTKGAGRILGRPKKARTT